MYRFEWTIVFIIMVLLAVVIIIGGMMDGSKKKYRACNNGSITQCIRFDEYEIQGECLLGENEERICGSYILKIN